jgi:hypothetical protein
MWPPLKRFSIFTFSKPKTIFKTQNTFQELYQQTLMISIG